MCGCGGGACIPQRRYEQGTALRPHELQEILFGVNAKCGYPLEDALGRLYTGLDGRDDEVFVGFEFINIRLEVRRASARSDGGFELRS